MHSSSMNEIDCLRAHSIAICGFHLAQVYLFLVPSSLPHVRPAIQKRMHDDQNMTSLTRCNFQFRKSKLKATLVLFCLNFGVCSCCCLDFFDSDLDPHSSPAAWVAWVCLFVSTFTFTWAGTCSTSTSRNVWFHHRPITRIFHWW